MCFPDVAIRVIEYMRTAFIHVPHATRVICFWGCAHRLKRRPWGKVVVSGPSDELRTARAFEILLFCVLRFICRVPFKASGHAANLQRARRKQAWPIVIWCLDAWKDSGEMVRAAGRSRMSCQWALSHGFKLFAVKNESVFRSWGQIFMNVNCHVSSQHLTF